MKAKTRNRIIAACEITTAAILFLGGIAVGRLIPSTSEASEFTYETVFVHNGDTLWSICQEYKPDGTNTREYVKSIMMLNNMSSSDIYPGDTIKVKVSADVDE